MLVDRTLGGAVLVAVADPGLSGRRWLGGAGLVVPLGPTPGPRAGALRDRVLAVVATEPVDQQVDGGVVGQFGHQPVGLAGAGERAVWRWPQRSMMDGSVVSRVRSTMAGEGMPSPLRDA